MTNFGKLFKFLKNVICCVQVPSICRKDFSNWNCRLICFGKCFYWNCISYHSYLCFLFSTSKFFHVGYLYTLSKCIFVQNVQTDCDITVILKQSDVKICKINVIIKSLFFQLQVYVCLPVQFFKIGPCADELQVWIKK